MRVKICGITQPQQGQAIADLGATALGFICVPQSPRYVNRQQLQALVQEMPSTVERIGVFANATLTDIQQVLETTELTGIQLHGAESSEFCGQVKQQFPQIEVIKALRIQTPQCLSQTLDYVPWVDTLLLDAYHPRQLGGTGQTLDWETLAQFQPSRPWLLAGGLTPDNITQALQLLHPDGIDLSSGVERSPGDKDLSKVVQLFQVLQN
ncbi:phosphoribosylanthranilate isomerase [Crocosphaera sp. UHCC 0190]|uniref:phosphoribosylanthranilate isomerase n=1 Tax=Crocosphaera sp. UHCC 0190 TaxID=3110246 RepID=UPI002B1FA273|nr:phosphoribosylanthranilate isomerase [Crocosphaera sp. UHCC 0190]MEA5512077.1 phosphoribosylanthranilate isomerase [Crocosphaera sp. UHCC 0190]